MDALYRAIVGTVEPLRRDHEVPEQYRRTLPAPPAPVEKIGDLSEEPVEGENPINDSSDTPI